MDKKEILKLLNKRPAMNYEDYSLTESYRKELVSAFVGNEDEIIFFLNSMSDKQLLYASEVFDELYDYLGESESFAKKLKEIQKKRPNIDLGLGEY